MSKIRARFSKTGDLKFISHLDTIRVFERAFRRANIILATTQGFNKHAKMAFANPMGVGLTSEDEYIEIELSTVLSEEELKEKLNKVLPREIEISKVKSIDDNEKAIMGRISAAEYDIKFLLNKEFNLEEMIKNLLAMEEILIEKKTKSGLKEIDIRNMIYSISGEVVNDKEYRIWILCACGSVENLSVETFVKALYKNFKLENYVDDYETHRRRLYIGEKGNFRRPIED